MKSSFSILSPFAICLLVITIIHSCEKDFILSPPVEQKSFTEEFDTVANLYKKGWVFINNSRPQGTATWQQGVYSKAGSDFRAFSYHSSGDEYIFAGFANGSGISTISSWMITPPIEMKNGDKFHFYTRTFPGSTYPDRLQIRLNLNTNGFDVGNTALSVGEFTTLIADINPTYAVGGYPTNWSKFEFTLSGLVAPLKRRIAFRYFVENGGTGVNSNGIGIDQFHFESAQ